MRTLICFYFEAKLRQQVRRESTNHFYFSLRNISLHILANQNAFQPFQCQAPFRKVSFCVNS